MNVLLDELLTVMETRKAHNKLHSGKALVADTIQSAVAYNAGAGVGGRATHGREAWPPT